MSDRRIDQTQRRPNVVLILNDDMGYSDLGCYGGEVHTPNLDRLAARGIRFTQFYNTARCSPSRASLLTGLHPHQAGIGILTEDTGPEGYAGNLNDRCMTIAEVLGAGGYATYMSGKWHMAHDFANPTSAWPVQRGFQKFYGTIAGAGSYYDPNTLTRGNENIEHEARDKDFFYTDAISDNAAGFIRNHAAETPDKPFFLYTAYTASHWPLHALPEDIEKYQGRFADGWDTLRDQRRQRMIDMGILDERWPLSERDPNVPPWDAADHKEWQQRRMEVYAAQIDRMDQGIGRIIDALEATAQLDNTLVFFLADNGACAEGISAKWHEGLVGGLIARKTTRDGKPVRFGNDPRIMPGPEDTYASCGIEWANVSDTPFRKYKHWAHEGGVATPLIVHWPAGIAAAGELRHHPSHLPDVMATVLEVTGVDYPKEFCGSEILPPEGASLVPAFDDQPIARGKPIFLEHEGNAAVRDGKWKLVRDWPGAWELYDLEADRTEMNDLAASHPDRVREMTAAYDAWAKRCGIVPREKIVEIFKSGKVAHPATQRKDS